MSRIASRLDPLRQRGGQALVPYVTAGDPDPASTVAVMHALARAGADVIELGVPFSDPMADGPVIQKASERALARGVGLARVLDMVREFRGTDAEAMRGFALLSRGEGIIPALETSHAIAWVARERGRWRADEPVLICLSGRGDKDVVQVSEMGELPDVSDLPGYPS